MRENTELKDDFEEETEVIYVNIWNKVDGELKLLGQKPMLKDTFKKMHKNKDFSSLLTLEAKPLTSIEIRPQAVVSKPLLEKPQFANKKTKHVSGKVTLLKGDPQFEQFVNRQASFLLNSGARLDLPPSLVGLLPSTVNPIKDIDTRNTSSQPDRDRIKPRVKTSTLSFQGVGVKSAQSSFTDTQATHNKQVYERFLQNPLLRERPFNQFERITSPPNFTPIPVPEVLRPSKLNRLPSGLDSALSATTEQPLKVHFEAKYGLKAPSQLSGWFNEMFHPVDNHVQPVKSPFSSPSQVKVPTALDLYGNYGNTTTKVFQKETEKKMTALEVWSSCGKGFI